MKYLQFVKERPQLIVLSVLVMFIVGGFVSGPIEPTVIDDEYRAIHSPEFVQEVEATANRKPYTNYE